MIKISDLSFVYPGADRPSLRNVSMEINNGDFLAIVGGNGCGKSTLCKAIIGLIPHFLDGDYEGDVEVDGQNTRQCSIGELATRVGYVYQDFENQIVRPTVLDDASFACLNYERKDYLQRGREALALTGLEEKETEYVFHLSGGQKHLLALSGAIALSPDTLILDEPIAQLDPRHAQTIYDVLKSLNRDHGKTIIVIEHHTEFIAEYCSHVALMREGELMFHLPAHEALSRVDILLKNQIHPPQVTLAAKALRDAGTTPQELPLPVTFAQAKQYFLPLALQKTPERKARTAAITEPAKEAAIAFRNVQVEYRAVKGAPVPVLQNFSLNIFPGEKVALIGSNGAGKSTLLKLSTGMIRPNRGEVAVNGHLTRGMTPEQLAEHASLVYQNPEEMFISDSIRGDIAYAMRARSVPEYEERVAELLDVFRLEELSQRDGRLLSGGQMRRASLAIGIALKPPILLLDEPTANLDIATRKQIMQTLRALKGMTETIVIATHDMQLVTEWAERVIVLCGGYVIADGPPEAVFRDRFVSERVGILPPQIFRLAQALELPQACFTVEEFCGCYSAKMEEERYVQAY